MKNFSISLYTIWVLGIYSACVHAQTDAADAAAIFDAAESLAKSFASPEDLPLKNALKTLIETRIKGNQQLLNREVRAARRTAELVSAQMELVKLYGKLAEMKERLRNLQNETAVQQKRKSELEAQYRRLILKRDGRALTDAYPAPDSESTGEE